MFLRDRLSNGNGRGTIDADSHDNSIRPILLVLALLTCLSASPSSKCQAAAGGAPENDEKPAASNLTINARASVPSDAGSQHVRSLDLATFETGDDAPAFAAPPPLLAADPSISVLGPARITTDLSRPRRCLLFQETLCRATRDKPVLALAAAQTLALVGDGVTTRQYLRRGYVEVDPFTRILLGRKPTWARMTPLGAVQVAAGMWVAERMAISRHKWVRRIWWLPQAIGIAGNLAATLHNTTLLR